jgi:hypothetical protein
MLQFTGSIPLNNPVSYSSFSKGFILAESPVISGTQKQLQIHVVAEDKLPKDLTCQEAVENLKKDSDNYYQADGASFSNGHTGNNTSRSGRNTMYTHINGIKQNLNFIYRNCSDYSFNAGQISLIEEAEYIQKNSVIIPAPPEKPEPLQNFIVDPSVKILKGIYIGLRFLFNLGNFNRGTA